MKLQQTKADEYENSRATLAIQYNYMQHTRLSLALISHAELHSADPCLISKYWLLHRKSKRKTLYSCP